MIHLIELIGIDNNAKRVQDDIQALRKERSDLIAEIENFREHVAQNQQVNNSELARDKTDLEEFL